MRSINNQVLVSLTLVCLDFIIVIMSSLVSPTIQEKALLEAVAFVSRRIVHINAEDEPSNSSNFAPELPLLASVCCGVNRIPC